MRFNKLYIKISLSIIAVLFITLFVVFALFLISPGRQLTTRLEAHTKAKVLIVKAAIEDKIRLHSDVEVSKNKTLRDFILDFGNILGAKVWLQRSDGTIAIKSFTGEVPALWDKFKRSRVRNFGQFKLYRRRHSDYYAIIPIDFPKTKTGSIHILFEIKGPPDPARGFALGLIIIGLIIGLLIIPISKFIIKPIKKLNRSALKIADGDLSHRASVKSRDEIGELCRSFNHMADKLEKMIISGKELTANVSHELRTPLARIHIAETLIREKLEGQNHQDLTRHLDNIREDIGQLDQLIGRILDLSKLDLHESPLQMEAMDPTAFIQEILGRLQPAMEQKMLILTTGLNFESSFKADKNGLYSVFSNVLDNAVKFIPPKGHISVAMDLQKDWLYVRVLNTFETLSDKNLQNIFEPFYRSPENKQSGSGLGLAIAKKIIQKHGGIITAQNVPEGLQIEIGLPRNL